MDCEYYFGDSTREMQYMAEAVVVKVLRMGAEESERLRFIPWLLTVILRNLISLNLNISNHNLKTRVLYRIPYTRMK